MPTKYSPDESSRLEMHKVEIDGITKYQALAIQDLEKISIAMIEHIDKRFDELGASNKERAKEQSEFEKQLADRDGEYYDKLTRTAYRKKLNDAKNLSLYERKQKALDEAEAAKQHEESVRKQINDNEKKIKKVAKDYAAAIASGNAENIADLKEKLEDAQKASIHLAKDLQDSINANIDAQAEAARFARIKTAGDALDEATENWAAAAKRRSDAEVSHAELVANINKLDEKDRKAALKASKKNLDASIKEEARAALAKKQAAEKAEKEAKKEEDRGKNKAKFTTKEGWEEIGKEISNATGKLLGGFLKDLTKSIDSNISDFYQYQAKYEARLQGSDSSYAKSLSKIANTVSVSPYVKQKDVVKKLQDLVETGTNYNLELRSYLATVSEGIASTFNAFDSNLLKIIRLQQKDSTAARLGMEASLNKLYNRMFSDTSYLNDAYDSVTQAIQDASGLLTHEMSTEFEYVVQKWLGSLYSLGISNEAVTGIAGAINLLGSGNIETLSSNDQMLSLLAMSAQRGGTSLSTLLEKGTTAEETNKLLLGMITYLSEIAGNTSANNVVRASFGNVFGLSSTDIKAISNLTSADIETLYKTNLNYAGAIQETKNQIQLISSRTHLSTLVNTAVENALLGASLNIGSNTAAYGTWQALNIVEALTGGIAIPTLGAFGNFLNLESTVTGLAKTGIAGLSLLSTIVGGLGGLIEGGGLPGLEAWGFDDSAAIVRGKGLNLLPEGIDSGFSVSKEFATRGSASTTDIQNASIQSQVEAAKQQSEITGTAASGFDVEEEFYQPALAFMRSMEKNLNTLATDPPVSLLVIDNTGKAVAKNISTELVDDYTKLEMIEQLDTYTSNISTAATAASISNAETTASMSGEATAAGVSRALAISVKNMEDAVMEALAEKIIARMMASESSLPVKLTEFAGSSSSLPVTVTNDMSEPLPVQINNM